MYYALIITLISYAVKEAVSVPLTSLGKREKRARVNQEQHSLCTRFELVASFLPWFLMSPRPKLPRRLTSQEIALATWGLRNAGMRIR